MTLHEALPQAKPVEPGEVPRVPVVPYFNRGEHMVGELHVRLDGSRVRWNVLNGDIRVEPPDFSRPLLYNIAQLKHYHSNHDGNHEPIRGIELCQRALLAIADNYHGTFRDTIVRLYETRGRYGFPTLTHSTLFKRLVEEARAITPLAKLLPDQKTGIVLRSRNLAAIAYVDQGENVDLIGVISGSTRVRVTSHWSLLHILGSCSLIRIFLDNGVVWEVNRRTFPSKSAGQEEMTRNEDALSLRMFLISKADAKAVASFVTLRS